MPARHPSGRKWRFTREPYFLVAELSYEQIRGFLPRWYGISIPLGKGTASASAVRTQQLIDELLAATQKNEAVRHLAGTPLLLTLMAIMLQNGTRLPERRVELYQAVTKTLLESRNEIKSLPRLYEDEAIQRLGKLAFTMQGVGNNLAHRAKVEACSSYGYPCSAAERARQDRPGGAGR
ncbi:hypothetical protein KSF_076450 [Reticulibacter mediterranei]|uniref:Uncharacterized protein n=1 Tax=Reticulibacter mediterranei TaxID=2778369 RepID=A0A8J3N3Z1_9CHLR|nr:hypothetical protein [Reticulibacter mediterranei]GHO97597.1 hypothetical protein KSF_076450 [Reticulibacter mediterranei]